MKGPSQGQGIQLKQTQVLAVTPQMTQRLKILQCNQQQLELEIQQMLDKNIMLDMASDIDFEIDGDIDRVETDDFDTLPDDLSDQVDADMEWEDIYDDDYLESFDDRPKKVDDVSGFQDDWVADVISLDARIEQSIFLSALTDEEKQIANTVLEHLDADYFLIESVESLAKTLKIEMHTLRHVVDVIKHLDPVGVASNDVRDCLLAQLHTAGDNSSISVNAHEIISEYFDYIDKKPELICARLGVDDAEFQQAMLLIRALSPFPNPSVVSTAQNIKPEAFVRQRMGMFYASPNQDARFDLEINETYVNLTGECKGDEKQFMKAQLQEAKFFIDALSQRHKTVVRVANAIVMQQQDYFIEGEKAMCPLVMREIAEQLELSESTISRAVNGKYLSFNQKLIELRFFFTRGLASMEENDDIFADEVATSATAAKAHIKEIIAADPPRKPISDAKIETILKERGIDISRRTVAKYREALGIPKASQRKRLK